MMEDIVAESVSLLAPLLVHDPLLANMDHRQLLLHPPIRYMYDAIMAISLSFPALSQCLTPLDRNRNLALKNGNSQRAFFRKIAAFAQWQDNGHPSSPGFDTDVLLKGQGAKDSNLLLQRLAKMAARSHRQLHQAGQAQPTTFLATNAARDAGPAKGKKPSKKFVGHILRPKSITLASSSTGLTQRKTSAVPAAKALAAASCPPAVAKAATLPSLRSFEAEKTLGAEAVSHSPLTQCPAVDGQEGLLDRDGAVQQAPKLCHIPTCQPVGTEDLSHLLEEMRQLANTIHSLKLENSHILTDLAAAHKTIRATSRSLNLLEAYSSTENSIEYPSIV